MTYNKYVSDPNLRKKLNKARSENILRNDPISKKSKLSNDHSGKNDLDITIKAKERTRDNKKFDSFKSRNKKRRHRKKLNTPSTKSLAIATKQLSSMIRTGLPLLEALNILAESSEEKTLKIVFQDASKSISRGSTFVAVLEQYPEVFDEMYLALISAGETAGLLPEVLDREAKLLESLAKIKGQIKSALAYPIAILVLTIAVIIIMLVFVIPIFVDMYSQSGTDLPQITQLLVNGSNMLRDPKAILKAVPIIFSLVFILRNQMRKEYFLNWRDYNLLRLPIIKDLVTK